MSRDTRIATLRDRVTIQRPIQQTHPETGEAILAWQTIAAGIPARVRTAGTKTEEAERITPKTAAEVRIRWRSGIDAGFRLLIDGRVFDVRGVDDPDRRRRWLDLTATETR